MATRIQTRRDTLAHWEDANPILAEGEEAIDTTTMQKKIGDGETHWKDLPYYGFPCVQQTGNSTTEAMSQAAVTKAIDGLYDRIGDVLIDYGDALSKYGGSPAIDYGNARTVADF